MAFILSDPEKYLNQTVMLPEHLPTSITAEVAHDWLKKHGEADIKGNPAFHLYRPIMT